MMMRGMQLIRPGSFAKADNAVSSILRDTSCSHGWLRVVVQSIFAVITITSFILIVYMALQNPWNTTPSTPEPAPRCRINKCSVSCDKTPFYGDYNMDIINAMMEVKPFCIRTWLVLNSPMFKNEAIPANWLAELRIPIHELVISGGNLMHIPPDTFMSHYSANIRILVFHNISIKTWTTDSFIGLSNLRQIHIRDCNIIRIGSGALRSVDDTLKVVSITNSGKWTPTNVTGSSRLVHVDTVDFSGNRFNDILDKHSFTGIKHCKVLYLNDCGITALGAGTFDHLMNIEMLFLNKNFLVTIPSGLFSNFLKIVDSKNRPRINLQGNFWYCDCKSDDIRQLVEKDILVIDPVCYQPDKFAGKTFSEVQMYCRNDTDLNKLDMSLNMVEDKSDIVIMYGACYNGNEGNKTASLISATLSSSMHTCPTRKVLGITIEDLTKNNNHRPANKKWLKSTFFLKTKEYSVIQLGVSPTTNRGLLWYESTCPDAVYCLDTVPTFLRVYNVDLSASYVFCPILLTSGEVESDNCVVYNLVSFTSSVQSAVDTLLYVTTVIGCLVFGAMGVYLMIRRNPTLLRGSKRILFVKHKTLNALVLPPEVPLRNGFLNDHTPDCSNDKIFIIPGASYLGSNFNRQKSTRSDNSYAPSYVSALQPTDDQLAEWRLKRHFSNPSITAMNSNISTSSLIKTHSITDLQYLSLHTNYDSTYESLN